MKNKLWDKNFTIITIGSLMSMLGNSVSNLAFSFLVYDRTQSTFLFALMMVVGMLPQLFVPIIAGAYLDRKSRRKAIYTIDFITSGLFIIVTIIVGLDFFSYSLCLLLVFVFGCLGAFYMVAYDSYYPTLISKGNYSKAYSVSSLLYPIASTIMVPVAGWAYDYLGLMPLFAFSTAAIFITAVIETRVDAKEPHLESSAMELQAKKETAYKQFVKDLKFGFSYLKSERGLLTITVFFFFMMSTGAVVSTLFLPYLKTTVIPFNISFFSSNILVSSTILYSIIMSANTLGRIIGGLLHYKFKLPVNKKYAIAIFVYLSISVLDGTMLFTPYIAIIIMQLFSGILSVTSFNIRTSGTQNYIPDTVRGRFNGIFALIVIGGSMIGQLIGGALGEIYDARYLVAGAMAINIISIIIMIQGKEGVKKIYNCDI